MQQILDVLRLQDGSVFDTFTASQILVYALILLVDFLLWTALRCIIPWLVALLKKKPMPRKWFRVLSIVIALYPLGNIYVALQNRGASDFVCAWFPLFCSACVFAGSYFPGIAILRKRNRLAP